MSKIIWKVNAKKVDITPSPLPPTDYIAYYKFDGDVHDETGNFNGGSNTLSYVNDRGSKMNAYVNPKTDLTINVDYVNTNIYQYSVSYWFKSLADPSSGSRNGYIVLKEWIDNGGSFCMHGWDNGYFIGCGAGSRTVIPLTKNIWYLLTVTFDHGLVKIYKNTDLYYEVQDSNYTYAPSLSYLCLGSNTWTQDYYISDFRIYDRVLSSIEIERIYNEY